MAARRRMAVLLGCGLVAAGAAHAQSAQPWSVQASYLLASQKIGDKSISGNGIEAQIRYTPAAVWTIGAGFQFSSHPSGGDKINIAGGFLEPRYTIDVGSNWVAPYLAARLALLSETLTLQAFPGTFTSMGSAFGAGAGILIRASKRVNVDIGGAFVRQSFSDATSGAQTVTFPSFTGYVFKVGASFGFGTR